MSGVGSPRAMRRRRGVVNKEFNTKVITAVGEVGKVGIMPKKPSGEGLRRVRVFQNVAVGIRRIGNRRTNRLFGHCNSTTPTGALKKAVKRRGDVWEAG